MANLSVGGGSFDPYSDPGGGVGIGLPSDWQVFPTPIQPAPTYPVGPYRSSNYYSPSRAKPKVSSEPPPDPWSGVSSAVHSKATQVVDQFESLVGGAPQGFDSAGTSLALARSGVNVTGSDMDAFQWLYTNKLSLDQQLANPWAQFGMGKDLYETTVKKLDSAYFDWTGDQLSLQNLGENGGLYGGSPLWQAIRQNWTPDQVRNYAMFGNATGSGELVPSAQFSGDMPWLSAGQSYTQVLQQFEAFEQTTPADKATLAAFWRFGTSAKQLQGGAGTIDVAAQKQLATGAIVR
jgi:hypothetical protein